MNAVKHVTLVLAWGVSDQANDLVSSRSQEFFYANYRALVEEHKMGSTVWLKVVYPVGNPTDFSMSCDTSSGIQYTGIKKQRNIVLGTQLIMKVAREKLLHLNIVRL